MRVARTAGALLLPIGLAACAAPIILGIPENKQLVMNRSGQHLTCQLGMVPGGWSEPFVLRNRGQWSRQPALPSVYIRCGGAAQGTEYYVRPGKRLLYVNRNGQVVLIEGDDS